MKIGELFFNLGFHADTMKLRDFGKAVGDLNVASILSAGSFGALYEGAKKLVEVADSMALGINKFTDQTGESSDSFQRWTKVAEQAGVSAGVVDNTLASLGDSITAFRKTGEDGKSNIWKMLGINPTDSENGSELLINVLERLRSYNVQDRRFWLEKLGLSTELLSILNSTADVRSELAKQDVLDASHLQELRESLKINKALSEDIQLIWAKIGVSLLPVLDKMVQVTEGLTKFANESKDLQAFLGTVSKAGEGVGQVLGKSAQGWALMGQLGSELGKTLVQGSTAAFLPSYNALAALDATHGKPGESTTVTNHITVTGGDDPEKTARKVREEIEKTFSFTHAGSARGYK